MFLIKHNNINLKNVYFVEHTRHLGLTLMI